MKIVIDTNILISAIIKNGFIRNFVIRSGLEFISPAYTLSEIEKYKEKICKKANMNTDQLVIILQYLINYIKIINPLVYKEYLEESKEIMKSIDIKDAPFLACAMAFDAYIWSDDEHFKKQSRIKVLTTKEIVEFNR